MRQWLLSLAAGLLLAQQPLALQPGRPAPSHRVTERSKGRIASPEQYIGAAACGACHPSQLARQSKTAHARALFPAPAHPLAGSFGFGRVLQRERYSFELSRSGGSLLMEIYDQESILKLPLDWAFGAGEHSVTFVSRIREDLFLEHAFSYYRKSGSFDLTPGHETAKVENLHQAAGLLYNIADPARGIVNCFGCHSTGPVAVTPERDVRPAEAGVRCEACHGPGGRHREAALAGRPEAARKRIGNPRRLAPEELNQFCGRCHRFPGAEQGPVDWSHAWNVRHQPPYFRQSRCFQVSGKLSCLACHGPHEPVRRHDEVFYSKICSGCHAKPHPEPARSSGCAVCHMPEVKASEHLSFRNHWIGVYDTGASLRPRE